MQLNPFEQMLENEILTDVFGGNTAVASMTGQAGNAVAANAGKIISGAENVYNNLGIFTVGILLFMLGIGLLVFAFGDRLAGAAESVLAKIPAVVPV